MIRLMRFVIVSAGLILLWHLLVVLTDLPPFILPGPMRVATALFGNLELISQHALVTIAAMSLVATNLTSGSSGLPGFRGISPHSRHSWRILPCVPHGMCCHLKTALDWNDFVW